VALDAVIGDIPVVKSGRWLTRSTWNAASAIKNAVANDRPCYLTVPFGPARGGGLYTT